MSACNDQTYMKREGKKGFPGERVRQLVLVHGNHRQVHNLVVIMVVIGHDHDNCEPLS